MYESRLTRACDSPVFEVGNYNVLGRILYYVPYHSYIHPGRVATTFGFLGVVVEALNGQGVARSANTSLSESQQEVGRSLLKAALVMQLGIIMLFLLLAGSFHRRCRRAGIRKAGMYHALHTMYISTALLLARTIYRTVEYLSISNMHITPGMDPSTLSPLLRYEWFFYVFEASLMLANQVLLNVRHPRKFLPKSTKIYLGKDGETEIAGPGYKDTRPFWLTLVDPFDFAALFKGQSKQSRFWETHEADEANAKRAGGATPRNPEDPEAL
jgi:hypothetical protein